MVLRVQDGTYLDTLSVIPCLTQGAVEFLDVCNVLRASQQQNTFLARLLRYSSHTARSGLGLAGAVRLLVWPRHVKLGMLVKRRHSIPSFCETSAQGGNRRRTGRLPIGTREVPSKVVTGADLRVVGAPAVVHHDGLLAAKAVSTRILGYTPCGTR